MERPSKRGKIPQQDWPSILERYKTGETLASIARTYDCSPPAISYVVSRSRARDSAIVRTVESSEPRLTEAQASQMPTADGLVSERTFGETRASNVEAEAPSTVERLSGQSLEIVQHRAPSETTDAPDLQSDPAVREGNGLVSPYVEGQRDAKHRGNGDALRPAGLASVSPPQNGEQRRTLHLSLMQDSAHRSDAQYQDATGSDSPASGERFATRPAGAQQGFVHPGRQGPIQSVPASNSGPIRMVIEPHREKKVAVFIDQALRERVDGDITAFLAAFDAALAHDSPENRAGLRDATDRLLRAGARTRIELERLEARVPLPSRDGSGQPAAWRPR